MSGREWKPGEVQVVLSMHPARVQEFGTWLRHQAKDPDAPLIDYADQIAEQGHGARLVVIDPENREAVERLMTSFAKERWDSDGLTCLPGIVDHAQAALREFADPKPVEVFEHFVDRIDGGLNKSVCGKVWRPNPNTVATKRCPDCVAHVEGSWAK